jgi:hypothetical protein
MKWRRAPFLKRRPPGMMSARWCSRPDTINGRERELRIPRRRRPTPRVARLLAAAGLDERTTRELTELDVCRAVAIRSAARDSAALGHVLAVAEQLLLSEENYEFVLALLEDIQNLVSHKLKAFSDAEHVVALLGPNSAAAWATLTSFWTAVADWCASEEGLTLESSEKILSVQNEQLRTLLWTSNRTLATGAKLGIVHALRYEKAGQPPIPGYEHLAAVRDAISQD